MKLKARHRRFTMMALGCFGVALAMCLVLLAFRQNLVFFFTPTQVFLREAPLERMFRLGGLVEAGSLKRTGADVFFSVTDTAHALKVRYQGPLPDLFREGRGVVALGRLTESGCFEASEVLAKHDETYMPPEAAEALRRAGQPVGVPEIFRSRISTQKSGGE